MNPPTQGDLLCVLILACIMATAYFGIAMTRADKAEARIKALETQLAAKP